MAYLTAQLCIITCSGRWLAATLSISIQYMFILKSDLYTTKPRSSYMNISSYLRSQVCLHSIEIDASNLSNQTGE